MPDTEPTCGACGGIMTPANARQHPELFLHDRCLPDELRPPEEQHNCRRCKINGLTKTEAFIHEKLHDGSSEWSEFGNPSKLNALPFILFPIVAKLMEAYAAVAKSEQR
jgi:hypothetical protein